MFCGLVSKFEPMKRGVSRQGGGAPENGMHPTADTRRLSTSSMKRDGG
jgi:hypothetical protein